MGLIKAGAGALGGALADTWKEFFTCDSLSKDVLVARGQKQISGRSSNTKGSDNVISNGSGIAVAEGQCMIITDQGKIVEVCAEPGEFTYNSSTEPSIFCGSLGEGLKKTFSIIGKRFTYGGDTAKDQRVYYFNTKEIIDNKFGTATPIPFRVVDTHINLDLDTAVRCNGVYSYRIANPLLFFSNVCGNVATEYTKSEIETQLKSEFVSALNPAFFEISALEIRPNQLPGHADKLCELMNKVLTEKWSELRGLEIVSVSINSVTIPEKDQEDIKEIQRAATMTNPGMYVAEKGFAAAEAMKTAAGNSAGAMTGFMGMGMAMNQGNAQDPMLAALMQQQQAAQAAAPAQAPAANGWTCACGATNTGKFCTECGTPKPVSNEWTCACGAKNSGKFCTECGSPKPAGDWTCSCGATNSGKFCTECGKPRS